MDIRSSALARAASPDFPGKLVPVDLASRRATDAVLVDLTALEDVMRVNLYPALRAVQTLLPGMTERGWGRIVNITSLTMLGAVERAACAAAKAAQVSFSRSGRWNWRQPGSA